MRVRMSAYVFMIMIIIIIIIIITIIFIMAQPQNKTLLYVPSWWNGILPPPWTSDFSVTGGLISNCPELKTKSGLTSSRAGGREAKKQNRCCWLWVC